MSEIDKLEIKIVADAADAEKSVKKLSKTIEGIGKTGDSTKQIREIKSALESIKTPEIEINGIKEFAKQARIIAQNFSKAAKSAKEIGASLKGVNLGQLTKKTKKESAPVEDYSHLKDIPIFDMGKQINGKPIQDASKSMSDLTSETKNAESAAEKLSSAIKNVSRSNAPMIDQNKRLAESAMELQKSFGREGILTGVEGIDSGDFEKNFQNARKNYFDFKKDLEKSGLSMEFPEIEKQMKSLEKYFDRADTLSAKRHSLSKAGKLTDIKAAPIISELTQIDRKVEDTARNMNKNISSAGDKIRSTLENLDITGIEGIDNGAYKKDLSEATSLLEGMKSTIQETGVAANKLNFSKMERLLGVIRKDNNEIDNLLAKWKALKIEGKDTPLRTLPIIEKIKQLQNEVRTAIKDLKEMNNVARAKIPDMQRSMQEKEAQKRQASQRKQSNNKGFGVSIPKMVGMSVLYSTVFQLIATIKSAFAEGMQSLAQYSQSVNANISSMMSALMQLRNAFAAAFEPILSVVAPYLATFISWVARAINVLGQFIAALTGKGYAVQAKKVQMDYAKSLQKTAGGAGKAAKALKEMQDYTLGFDELHIIDKPSDSGSPDDGDSNDAGDLLPTDMFETVEIDSKIQDLAKRFKELLPLITSIAAGLAAWKIAMGLFKQLAELKKKLQELQVLSRLSLKLHRFPEVLSNIGLIIAELMKVAPTILGWSIVIGIIVGRFVYLYQTSESFRKGLERTKEIFKGILTVVGDVFKAVGKVLYDIGSGIWNYLIKPFLEFIGIDTSRIEEEFANFFRMIKDWLGKLDIDFGDLGITIAGLALLFIPGGQLFGGALLAFEGISVALRALGGVSDETWESIKSKAVEVWNSIKNFFKTTWDEIVNYYPEKWSEVKTSTAELWESVKTTISEKWTAIKDFFTKTIPQIVSDIVKWFSEMPSKVGAAISIFFTDTIPNWATSVYNTFSEKVNNIVTSVATWFAQLPQKIYEKIILFLEKITLWKEKSIEKVNTEVPKILDKVAEWFGKLPEKIMGELKKTIESIKSIGGFILDGILEGASNFGNKVGGFVQKLLSKVNKEAEIHSPSRLFKRETGVWIGAGIVEGMEESVKGAGSVIDEIVDKVSGGGSLAPVVSVEAPDISQWDATWAILRENFERLKADIISSMNAFYSSISAMTTNFGTVSKAQITAYLLKVYDNIYNTFDAIRQTLQQVSDEVTRMLNQMVSDANSLAGLTGKKYSHVGGYTMQQAQRFNIEMFANGGFPRSGEMFIAREAGAEMVGSIGGKTAVANNDQIERAIFNAVLTAMSQAMANGSSQPIELNQKIELDGDVIYNNQQKVSARRGINFGLGAFQR